MREVVIPVCVLLVLATLLIPLPAMLIDFLLAGNILLGLVLLVSTLYVSNPLKLSAFPSILLLATMYRLALNVSTTRLILSGKDPGEIIAAFGAVVVQGNIVVGLVIFLVITLVQFIVIAKGSERVAEVAARFTLDALPGKQMSIDADIRSGLIDVEEGAKRRQALQLESRFYGALDGSMKFIKGDAIAGIVITAINLIGGICLGVAMFDLSLGESAQRFSLYTIGDGLISQIPALLNSLAAGMIVTYVGYGEEGDNLAKSLVDQIGQVTAVKLLIAGLAVILAFAPGLPTWPFLILGAGLAYSGIISLKNNGTANIVDNSKRFIPKPPANINVLFGSELIVKLDRRERLVDIFEGLRQELFNTYGLIILAPEVGEHSNSGVAYQILIKGVTVKQVMIDELTDSWLDSFRADLNAMVSDHRVELVDDIMTRRILDYFDDYAPELIARVVPELASVTTITEIIRSLVTEQVSVRSFDLVLQAIAEHAKSSANCRELLEQVRIALKRSICEQVGMFTNEVSIYQVTPALDLMFLQVEKQSSCLEPNIIHAFVEECRTLPEQSVVISARGSRRFIKECFQAGKLDHQCLAVDELCNTAKWKLGRIIGSEIVEQGLATEQMSTALAA